MPVTTHPTMTTAIGTEVSGTFEGETFTGTLRWKFADNFGERYGATWINSAGRLREWANFASVDLAITA